MSKPDLCSNLDAFHDGQLDPAAHAEFCEHLATCATCARELHELAMVDATVARAPVARARGAVVVPFRRRAVILTTTLLTLAASLLIFFLGRAPTEQLALVTSATARPLEARVSFEAGDAYRPYEVLRGGPARRPEVSFRAIEAFQQRNDVHGVAAGYLLLGEPARALPYLERAAVSLDVDADRALVAYEKGDLAGALAGFDAVLARDPTHGPANWNRALVLRDLGRFREAAAAFDAVARAGQPGWAQEATSRAEAARQRAATLPP